MPAIATCPSCQQVIPLRELLVHRCPAKQSKYRVAAREKRTDDDGIVYDSALEMKRMYELEEAKRLGEITDYIYHVRVRLGDIVYETDFLVIGKRTVFNEGTYSVHFEDVKGAETREFKRVRKLWPKYQKLPLVILKRSRDGGWEREQVTP